MKVRAIVTPHWLQPFDEIVLLTIPPVAVYVNEPLRQDMFMLPTPEEAGGAM